MKRLDFETIVNEFKNRKIELLTTKDEFLGTTITKLRYICPKHGEQKILWNNFRKGAGCRKCADEANAINQRKDFNDIRNFFANKPFQLVSRPEDYTSAFDYCLECECKKHGRFKMCWNNARRGDGCPRCKMSKGESKIAEILKYNCYTFETEKTFDTCKSNKNRKYRFDFYVDNRYLIEYDGEQHYTNIQRFSNMNYKERQDVDFIKSEWAINNKIPLIRISYKEINNININDLIPETSEYLVRSRIGAWAIYA